MSFQLDSDPMSLAGASLIQETVREIQRAFSLEKKKNKLTQQGLANRLKLKHRSTVNRWLAGRENLCLKTIGELAWAMNKRARIILEDDTSGNFFDLVPESVPKNKNHQLNTPERAIGSWQSHKQKIEASQPVIAHV